MKNYRTICRRKALIASAVVASGLGTWRTAAAQSAAFPSSPVKVIVPFPAGGSLDVVIRAAADPFQQLTGQPLLIENVSGAGGMIAGAKAATAAPDGHTLFLASPGQISIAPFVVKKMSYDPDVDFVPIVHMVNQPLVLYASTKSPFSTIADIVGAAKASPQSVAMSSSGIAGIPHLAMELLGQTAGVKFNHVAYKGGAPAIQAVAAGDVPLTFSVVGSAKALTAAGLVRPVAVAADERIASLPNVPTFAQAGLNDLVVVSWIGLMAPRGVPSSVVQRINQVVGNIMRQPGFQRTMSENTMQVRGGTPEDFKAFIQADTAKWAKVTGTLGLKE